MKRHNMFSEENEFSMPYHIKTKGMYLLYSKKASVSKAVRRWILLMAVVWLVLTL